MLIRHRKTDTDIAAARREDRSIYANEFALEVDVPSAGVAGVDWGVRLDEILMPPADYPIFTVAVRAIVET
jgi:hypothetical protein